MVSLAVNFRRSVIITELGWPEVAKPGTFLKQFLRFFWKHSVPKVYMETPIDVVVFKCRKICLMGNRRNRALFTAQKKTTKFPLPLKLSVLRGSRQKCAKASSQHLAHIIPDFIQIGSLSVEL